MTEEATAHIGGRDVTDSQHFPEMPPNPNTLMGGGKKGEVKNHFWFLQPSEGFAEVETMTQDNYHELARMNARSFPNANVI